MLQKAGIVIVFKGIYLVVEAEGDLHLHLVFRLVLAVPSLSFRFEIAHGRELLLRGDFLDIIRDPVLVEMLRLWGYTVEGSVFGTPDDLATYLEDRDAQYTETGYVYISIGATDGDYDTAPVRCYLSTDCEHILLVTGGTDMTVSSVWWAD